MVHQHENLEEPVDQWPDKRKLMTSECLCGLVLKVPYEYSQIFCLNHSSTVVLSTSLTLLLLNPMPKMGEKNVLIKIMASSILH